MLDQFGLEVGPGFVGGGGATIYDLPSYQSTQNDMGAIRELMATQGAGYLVTGNGSLENGGDSTAYLPQMMNQAGIKPTQGILDSYMGVTGQAYNPGSQTQYNPQSGRYEVNMSGVTGAIDNGMAGIADRIGSVNSGLSNLGNQFGNVTSQIGQLGGQFTQGFDSIGGKFTNAIDSLGGSLGGKFNSGLETLGSSLGGQLGQLGSQFTQGFDSLGNSLSTQFGGLNNSLSTLAQRMTQPDEQLQSLNQNFGSFLDMYKQQFERTPYQPKAYEKSPFVDQMVQATTDQVNNNWQRNQQPGIASQAQSVGGYGGSRQGVVEANALNDINRNLASTTANIYQTDYENQQNRNLQEYAANNNLALGMGGLALNAANANNQNQLGLGQLGLGIQNSNNSYNLGQGQLGLGYTQANNSYNLGLGNLGLGAQTATNNFYTAQRGQDLQQYGLGAQLAQMGNQGFLNQGSGLYDTGTQYQNAPWSTMGQFNNVTTPYTGFGATSTTSQGSNPWAQALGGAIAGGQVGRLF